MVPYNVLNAKPNSNNSQPPARPLDVLETACASHQAWVVNNKGNAWNTYMACFRYVEAWYGIDQARKFYKHVQNAIHCKPLNPKACPIESHKPDVPEWFDGPQSKGDTGKQFSNDAERMYWPEREDVHRGPEYVLSHEFREDQEMWLECGDSVDGPPRYTREEIERHVSHLKTLRKRIRTTSDPFERDLTRDRLTRWVDKMEQRYEGWAKALTDPNLTNEQLEAIIFCLRTHEYTWVDGERYDLKPAIPTQDIYDDATTAWTGIGMNRGSGGREIDMFSRFDDKGGIDTISYHALEHAILNDKTDPCFQLSRVNWAEFFRRADAHTIVRGLQAILFAVPELFWDAMNTLEEAVGEFNALTFGGIAESEPFACSL